MKFINIFFTLIICFLTLPMHGMISDLKKEKKQQKKLNEQLFEAVKNNDSQGIKRLLLSGANIEAHNDVLGWTPLMTAAFDSKNLDAFQTLLDEKANINAVSDSKNTPLHIAARAGNVQAIQKLIDAGAQLDAVNEFGATPLHTSDESDNSQAAQMLINAGAQLEVVNKDGETPLQKTVKMHFQGNVAMLDLLIKAKANVHVLTKDGNTPLHLAAERDIANAIPLLINAGLSVDDKNKNGQTPLHVIGLGPFSNGTIKKLIESGANINTLDNTGHTPLQSALIKYNEREKMKFHDEPNYLKAFFTTVSPKDIQHVIPSFIWLKSPLRSKDDLPFPRDIGKMICNRIIPDIVNEKLALARKYVPGMFSEDVLRTEIIQNIKNAINNSPNIPARSNPKNKKVTLTKS